MKIINKSSFQIQGFTLVEVLVASVILFASIATVSMVYRGAFLSSEKAEQHVYISGVLPSILAKIKKEINVNSKLSVEQIRGQGIAWECNYQWQANLTAFEAAPEKLDVDSGNYVNPPKKYKLWSIKLFVTKDKLTKSYSYRELGWTND